MLVKSYSDSKAECFVSFVIKADEAGGAAAANLVGDFNNWDRSSLPMAKRRGGGFELAVKLAAGREYQFRYLLDGERWENDWNADKYLPGPYAGQDNGVVIV